MPTIHRIPGAFRFYFYSFDCTEAPHVHVRRADDTCKIWLDGLGVARNHGFSSREMTRIRAIILEHRLRILEAWDEHCGGTA